MCNFQHYHLFKKRKDFAHVIILVIHFSVVSSGTGRWSDNRSMLQESLVWADMIKTIGDYPLQVNISNSESKSSGSEVHVAS